MRVAVTGAAGFLGWHLRTRLHALHPDVDVVAIDVAEWDQLPELLTDVDAVVHLAGINRASEEEVREGNVALAQDLLDALGDQPQAIVVAYANSIQAGNGTPYGTGKEAAAATLAEGLADRGVRFVDVHLPNLFGEHGRPRYNSFVPTFIEAALNGETPQIQDREIELLPAQEAAQVFLDAIGLRAGNSSLSGLRLGNSSLSERGTSETKGVVEPRGHAATVQGVWDTIAGFRDTYAATGDIPVLATPLDVALFNTFRAAMFPERYPLPFEKKADARGWLVETVRAHGSEGQTFVSTTAPGVTRGEHFHLRKFERFVVLQGNARIQLRKALTDEVLDFDVDGEHPCAVDMPVGWTHNITNTGDTELLTVFWTNELFDAADPDTYYEKVVPEEEQ